MALGLTQPLTEMSTSNISCGGKGGRCVGLSTLPTSCADRLEILGASGSWKSYDLSCPVEGLFYVYPKFRKFCYSNILELFTELLHNYVKQRRNS